MSLDEDGKNAWMCSIRLLINLFSTELSGMGLEPGFQALEPLPGEVSYGMARFCQQGLVKALV